MKKKILKITMILFMLILTCSTVANALSFTATITPSSTTVAESTEFTVSIKVSNLDVGQNGINALSGYLKYDTSVFEVITDSSIEGLNSWNPSFNSENGKITLTKTTFVKNEESVFQIAFKTKSGVSGKKGTIAYTNILATNSEQEISAADISTTITIGTSSNEEENGGNQQSGTNNNGTSSGGSNNSGTSSGGSNNSGTSSSGSNNSGTSSGGSNNSGTSSGGSNTVTILPGNTTNNGTSSSGSNNNGTSSNTTGNTLKNNYNTTNSVTGESIPYTGTEDTLMYIIFVVMALAIVFYIKFQKINKELK